MIRHSPPITQNLAIISTNSVFQDYSHSNAVSKLELNLNCIFEFRAGDTGDALTKISIQATNKTTNH